MLKLVAGLAALFIAVPAVPQAVPARATAPEFDTPPIMVDIPGIAQVMCAEGSGTAFRVAGPGAYTSVNHVTEMHDCKVDGEPLRTVYADKQLDFSSSRVTSQGDWLKINCGGFLPGQVYMAVGYARGTQGQRAVFLTPAEPKLAALVPWDHYTVLVG